MIAVNHYFNISYTYIRKTFLSNLISDIKKSFVPKKVNTKHKSIFQMKFIVVTDKNHTILYSDFVLIYVGITP